jgi:hypothetical protein
MTTYYCVHKAVWKRCDIQLVLYIIPRKYFLAPRESVWVGFHKPDCQTQGELNPV